MPPPVQNVTLTVKNSSGRGHRLGAAATHGRGFATKDLVVSHPLVSLKAAVAEVRRPISVNPTSARLLALSGGLSPRPDRSGFSSA